MDSNFWDIVNNFDPSVSTQQNLLFEDIPLIEPVSFEVHDQNAQLPEVEQETIEQNPAPNQLHPTTGATALNTTSQETTQPPQNGVVDSAQKETRYNYKCLYCSDITFSTTEELLKHVSLLHSYTFTISSKPRTRHFIIPPKTINQIKNLKCSIKKPKVCKFSCKTTDEMLHHVIENHPEKLNRANTSFICSTCGASYSTEKWLAKHEYTRHGQ